jgi:hypothetical protein
LGRFPGTIKDVRPCHFYLAPHDQAADRLTAYRRRDWRRIVTSVPALLIVIASSGWSRAGQTGRSNPLAGDGVNPVVYYFDYSGDGVTTDQIIHDQTNNTTDTIPLLNPDPFYSFLGNPPARDDLATTLVDGSSRLDEMGGSPGDPFQFVNGAGLDFLLPSARIFDVDATGQGGITVTKNVLGHQNISDAGGFTFESYVKRSTSTTGTAKQQIWSPEGAHSIEVSSDGNLQLFFRGLTAPVTAPVATVLPLGEWHHLMAVLDVVQPLPPGGDPDVDSLVAHYSLYIDGQLLGTTPDADMIQGACCILEFFDHEHGIGGSEFGAADEHFRGQMALTRLSLGVLTLEQSLFYTPPAENDGDYNENGVVDAGDYVVWRKTLGTHVDNGTGADGNGDGMISQPDFEHWRSRFGNILEGDVGTGNAAGVPEPSAVVLLAMGSFVVPLIKSRLGRLSATEHGVHQHEAD